MLEMIKKRWYLPLCLALGTGVALAIASCCPGPDMRDCHFEAFVGFGFALPCLLVWVSPGSFANRLANSVISAVYWLVVYAVFVGYQEHPWFAQPPEGGCDGPCFGWYTFEYNPPYALLLAVVLSSILLGSIVRLGFQSLVSILQKEELK